MGRKNKKDYKNLNKAIKDMKMADTYKPIELNDEEFPKNLVAYDFGSEDKFKEFLSYVRNEDVKRLVSYSRKWLRQDEPLIIISVFNRLENLVSKFFEGDCDISTDDLAAFEMLGRQYETIAAKLHDSTNKRLKEIRNQCYDRAINLFAVALQSKRAVETFHRSPFYSQIEELKRKALAQTKIEVRRSGSSERVHRAIDGIIELGPGHYRL
ncbi:hypothetical protein DRJ25_04060 [Candidatus Woesearchaeota archaeon]|nr:MAG: hypothetical protein DRJ25_04060 [Candidatus Woesearchaeota archaeon]